MRESRRVGKCEQVGEAARRRLIGVRLPCGTRCRGHYLLEDSAGNFSSSAAVASPPTLSRIRTRERNPCHTACFGCGDLCTDILASRLRSRRWAQVRQDNAARPTHCGGLQLFGFWRSVTTYRTAILIRGLWPSETDFFFNDLVLPLRCTRDRSRRGVYAPTSGCRSLGAELADTRMSGDKVRQHTGCNGCEAVTNSWGATLSRRVATGCDAVTASTVAGE